MRAARRPVLIAISIAAAITFGVARGEAHKPITSKFTYNEDVFPILRDRCGRCHVAGGMAPMSLMMYAEAFPWAESIRAELIAGHMPPWNMRPGSARIKNAPVLTAAELDKVLMWATGSTPQGNAQNVPPPVAMQRDWPLGRPDLVLDLPQTILAAENSETTQEFTVSTRTTTPMWVRAVDVLPGTPAIVRNAVVTVKSSEPPDAGGVTPQRVLALWVPGEDPVPAAGAAFHMSAGAEIGVRIHYLKNYTNEGKEMTDRSAVGLYFADGPSKEIKRLAVASPPVTSESSPSLMFSRTVAENLQVLAFSADPAMSNVGLDVSLVTASGVRTPLMHLAARASWTRRYWFEQPLSLPSGTRIEVAATLNGADPLLPPAGTPLPPQRVDGSPLEVVFDVVPSQSSVAGH